jgi:hypothetical protein
LVEPTPVDSDSDSDPTTLDTSTTDTETTFVGAQDCDWEGTWLMTQPRCDAAPFSQWFDTYDTTILVMTHNRTRGCDATFTLDKPGTCTETEEWYILEDPGNITWDVKSSGIIECAPESCKFYPQDGECILGARASDQVPQVNDSVDGVLEFTFLSTYAAPQCAGALRLKFERQ